MDTSGEVTMLIKYSPKREKMLEPIKELLLSIEDESTELVNYLQQDERFLPNAFKGTSRIRATDTNCRANV